MALTAIDFNNDNIRDLIWRNYLTGDNVAWSIDGSLKIADIAIAPVADTAWLIVGAAHISPSVSPSNLFWRYVGSDPNLRGTNVIWGNLSNGVAPIVLQQVPDLNWRVESVVDLGLSSTGANQTASTAMVWRNYATGQNLVWFLTNGIRRLPDKILPSVGDLNWEIAAVDDFNQDNAPDLVWRNNSSGQNVIWYLDRNFNKIYESALPTVADLNWRIEGAGDFNKEQYKSDKNSRQADILWRNNVTGQVLAWEMATLAPVRYDIAPGPGSLSLDWKLISASTDFNGDGLFDLLWWNAGTESLLSGLLNGNANYIGQSVLTIKAKNGSGWQPVTASKSDVTGSSSLFWQNSLTGQAVISVMNLAVNVVDIPLSVAAGWRIEDGVFSPTTGGQYVVRNYSQGADRGKVQLRYLGSGGQPISSVDLPTVGDLSWRIADFSDYNGDGYKDLLWRNYQTGEVGSWFFENSEYSSYRWVSLARVEDVSWELIDVSSLVGVGGASDFLWRNSATEQTVIWQMDAATKTGDIQLGFVQPGQGWTVL
jgi:hypothetical protein